MSRALILINNLLEELNSIDCENDIKTEINTESSAMNTYNNSKPIANKLLLSTKKQINKYPNFIRIPMTIYSESFNKSYLKKGRFITASYDTSLNYIIVYQAFRSEIANYASKHQAFGGDFYDFQRMTWIKTNFLWMMYRSNWANSKSQENILAIYLNLNNGFNILIKNCVNSKYHTINNTKEKYFENNRKLPYSENDYNKKIKDPNRIVMQWDPHHTPNGEAIKECRAIQLGIKGEYLDLFHKSILKIEDITDFVKKQNELRLNGKEFEIPIETMLNVDEYTAKNCMIGEFEEK